MLLRDSKAIRACTMGEVHTLYIFSEGASVFGRKGQKIYYRLLLSTTIYLQVVAGLRRRANAGVEPNSVAQHFP